ncbi:hypothetical protein LR48_Vigan02g120400 [Vigna angularis]|uniref:Uncharacterized protein n=1 Tax=Phaseolus angularis TaxID=3914 RepID=A0A0L9TXZ7_PHAAN|nr:hypothetical protein LR48_Vigan02g120400 [Vigna angularis]
MSRATSKIVQNHHVAPPPLDPKPSRPLYPPREATTLALHHINGGVSIRKHQATLPPSPNPNPPQAATFSATTQKRFSATINLATVTHNPQRFTIINRIRNLQKNLEIANSIDARSFNLHRRRLSSSSSTRHRGTPPSPSPSQNLQTTKSERAHPKPQSR